MSKCGAIPADWDDRHSGRVNANTARPLHRRIGQRDGAAPGIAVIAQTHFAIALDTAYRNAILRRHFQVCRRNSFRLGSLPHRSALRQTFHHAAQRIEWFRGNRPRRHRFQIRGCVGNAQCFRTRCLAQKTHHCQQLWRIFFACGQRPRPARPHIAAPLAAIVIHLQITLPLAAHFHHIALPQHGLLLRRFLGGGAQRRLVLHDNGQGRCRDN